MALIKLVMRLAALLLASSVCVAGQVDTLRTDLRPLIKAAADSPAQFAVLVPHRITAQSNGQWSTQKWGSAQWSYSVRIPTAVSMSFHATHIRLPASAVLTIHGTTTTIVYRASDLKKGDLWSRVLPGESLDLTIDVAATERSQVELEIQSFQAGYRALGAGSQDHPYFAKLQLRTAAASNSSCVQNYQCSVTPANTPIAKATVAIVVGNTYQCTGTLINDVPGDNIPYVLTARHCENGNYGGGTPGAAANVTVYWNATTPCASTLGTIYDPGSVTQSGATTVVEQQDAWLIKLDDAPVYTDAQFAGFDASGAAVQGGYTIHHALGFNDQLTQWFGQAYPIQQSNVLSSTFVSDFLETVNQAGNIGPGASGSGLVDGNNRLVGVLSLGNKSSDPSGYGSCPSPNPAAPNGSNGIADFTSLAGVWSSTADTTSSTGTVTLKSTLDPSSSGTQVVASAPLINLNFTASSYALADNDSLTLSWNAAGATACTASGGTSTDGWSGALPVSGSRTLTEAFAGSVKYSLTCQLNSGRQITNSVRVGWSGNVTYVFMNSDFGFKWVNGNTTLTWGSNLSPCSITGGGLSLSGLPSTGFTTTTQSSAGDVTYNISCGSSPMETSATTVSYVTPTLDFRATGTDRLVGQELSFYWLSYADTCIPSGGAPNDGWTSNAFGPANHSGVPATVPGTYTYTLTCSAGPNQVTKSVTVTIENNTPYTTLSIAPTTVTYSANAADYVTIGWKSNLTDCTLNKNPNNLTAQFTPTLLSQSGGADAEDSGPFAPGAPGDYVVSMTCTGGFGSSVSATSAAVTLHVLPPPPPTVTISTNPATVLFGQDFTINWSSTNAQNCTQTGNGEAIGVAWGAGGNIAPNGSQPVVVNEHGQTMIGITCASIDPNQPSASAQIQIGALEPTASLSISPTTVTNGQSFTLTWSSANAGACTTSGGGANGIDWASGISTSGSQTQTASDPGTFTYTVTCTEGTASVQSQATVTVSAASSGGSSGGSSTSSKGGGGGSLEVWDLMALLALLLVSRKSKLCANGSMVCLALAPRSRRR